MVSIKEEEEELEEVKLEMDESESSPRRSLTPPSISRRPPLLPLKPPQTQTQTPHENLSQIIAADRRIHGFSPLRSPQHKPIKQHQQSPIPIPESVHPLSPVLSPVVVVNWSIREELSVAAAAAQRPKVDHGGSCYSGIGSRRSADVENGVVGSGGGNQKSRTVRQFYGEREEKLC